MAVAAVWTPEQLYHVGDRRRWNGYIIECQVEHLATASFNDPWGPAESLPHPKLVIRRWRVDFDAMHHERRGDCDWRDCPRCHPGAQGAA